MKKVYALFTALICVILGVAFSLFIEQLYSNDNTEVAKISEDLYYRVPQTDMIVKNPDSGGEYVRNELIAEAADGVSKDEIQKLLKSYNGQIVGYIADTNTCQIAFDQQIAYTELKALEQKLSREPQIENICMNQVFHCSESGEKYNPNDPEWKDSWALEAIKAHEAWKVYMDAGITESVNVGIFEPGGVDADHEELKDNFANTPFFNGSDKDHGTLVAGIIGADFDNGIGMTGMVPNVKLDFAGFQLLNEKQKDLESDDDRANLMAYKVALTYLIARCQCKVINMSMGVEEYAFAISRGNTAAAKELNTLNVQLGIYLKILLDNGYDFLICKAAGNNNETQRGIEDCPICTCGRG